MAECMTVASPTHNVRPPRPPPPKFTPSKTAEDLISTKPRKPRARKFHSMHGRAKGDKPGMQRQVSLQEKLEENVTIETASGDANATIDQVDGMDHPVIKSKSPSRSPSRDLGGKASTVDGSNPIENSESSVLTTTSAAEPVTQPQANTSSSTTKATLQSNPPTGSSKRYRSISVEDDTVLLSKSSTATSEELNFRQRSKTLPQNLDTRQPLADPIGNKKKSAKKTPPPPIPSRPPVIMQYQNKHGKRSSISSQSSTPSIPEESTTPPESPRVIPPRSPKVIAPSPDLCTPEIKVSEQVEDATNKPKPAGLHGDNVSRETSPKPELSPTSKGKKKFLSGFKNTFRRRPKSPTEEKSMTLDPIGNRQPFIVSHRRVKTVKEDVTARSEEESLPGGVIPPIIVQCTAYLNRPASLDEEGLFRIPGDMSQIRMLRDGFISGREMDLSEILEPHTVAGLLKLHYREMRLCLIPRGEMSREITRAAKARDVDAVKDVLSQLPSENLALIRVVVELLKQVTNHSDKNQMTSGNLGASCGLSIFPTLQAGNASALLKCLIDHIDVIFPE